MDSLSPLNSNNVLSIIFTVITLCVIKCVIKILHVRNNKCIIDIKRLNITLLAKKGEHFTYVYCFFFLSKENLFPAPH